MFKWKNYWEVERRTVVLSAGGKSRQRMTPHREVEIVLSTPREMIVSIYADGKLTRRRTQAVESAFYIAGGDSEPAQSWFIVVRRDNLPGRKALWDQRRRCRPRRSLIRPVLCSTIGSLATPDRSGCRVGWS